MSIAATGPHRSTPWTARHVRALSIPNALALLVLLLGRRSGHHRTTLATHQIVWLNLGAAVLIIAALGNMYWLAHGRRAILTRRRRIVGDLTVSTAAPARTVSDTGWVHRPDSGRAHHPGCLLVAGKATEPVAPDALWTAGGPLRPCEVCAR